MDDFDRPPTRSGSRSAKSKKSKKKTSRQPSPDRLPPKPHSTRTLQPEAGPSRVPANPQANGASDDVGTRAPDDDSTSRILNAREVPKTDTFTNGADFIAFGDPDSERPKTTREWDKGKSSGGWDKDGRDGRTMGKKRRWEEVEQSDDNGRRQGANTRNPPGKAPWAGDVNWDGCRNVAEMLHKEVEAFLHYISPTHVEHEVRSMIVQIISNCIQKSFPDATVIPFGSFETKLYLPGGDIDLVIQSEQIAYSDKVAVLRTLANTIRRAGISDKVTIIAKAKVPIIKFITVHGRFSVDISLNQMNGVAAGRMINRFLAEIPALRALVLVVKSFLNQRSMNEVFSGGLGSYSIVCLAVSFLQMHPKLRRGEIDPSKNLGVLVMEFFELYGKYFNYSETGISLRHGGTYFSKARRGWLDNRKAFLLSIEDPGDISNDISRGSYGIFNVRQTFAGAYELMKSASYMRAGVLAARQAGRAPDLRSGGLNRAPLDPEEMSILASVLGVAQETINHRRLVLEVYDQGTLARLLGLPVPRPAETNGNADVTVGRVDRPTRAKEAQSVAAAWEEADMDLSSGEERDKRRHQERNQRVRHESESRYDIEQGSPARKRPRTGKKSDLHTVFTTDDEEGFVDEESGDSLAREEREYDVLEEDGNSAREKEKPISADRRRAYWASKNLSRGISASP